MVTKKYLIVPAVALALSAVPIFGTAATYAAVADDEDTEVKVTVDQECAIGAGSNTSAESLLEVALSLSTPSGKDTSSSAIGVGCNVDWTLTEKVDHTGLQPLDTTSPDVFTGADAFAAGGAAGTDASALAVNTWGMYYAAGSGATLTSGVDIFHALTTAETSIATGSAVSQANVTPTFGANTDGTVSAGVYGAYVTYTLNTN
ncbi:hypothetical protein FACS189431_1210 [Alphaproteobacteria bacterium]|nr:hypothetical protein FACS189431_1210 [Alphaproteobacteria bacterium]